MPQVLPEGLDKSERLYYNRVKVREAPRNEWFVMFPNNLTPPWRADAPPPAARTDVSDERPIDVSAVFRRDNMVIPVSFRTPDGEVVRLDRVVEKLDAATFKDRGVGDRYKVLARGRVSYLFRIGDLWYDGRPSDDMRIPGIHTRHTGAYHGGRRVVDKRYDNPFKVQVRVAALFQAAGFVVPFAFLWEDGQAYGIDEVTGLERAASVRAGIIGTRYSIRVRERKTYLYRDDDLWFMERRAGSGETILDVHGRRIV